LTVIVLTNLFGSNTGKINRGIAGIYLPEVAAPVYKPIEDKEPRVTARFVAVLRGSAEGGLRADDFTPAVWEYITSHADQMRRDMAVLGPIQKLLLVERTEQDGNRSYRYRAQFKRTTFIFHFVLSSEDRISVMMPDPQSD
jgi:hypothetical protein